MNKVLRFLKSYWMIILITLVTGYFAFFGGMIFVWILGEITRSYILGLIVSFLGAGFFAMLPVLILIGTSEKLEKKRKVVTILLTGTACACLFFLIWLLSFWIG